MADQDSTQQPSARASTYAAAWYAKNKEIIREQRRAKRDAARARPPEVIVTPNVKTCRKCAEDKPFTDFPIGKDYPDGRKASCKACLNAQRKAKYHTQRDLEVAKKRARKATPEWQASEGERAAAAKKRLEARIAENMPADRCCTKCASILPANTAYFNKSATGSFGLTASCIECLRKAHAKRAETGRERMNAQARESYIRHAPRKLAAQKLKRKEDLGFAIRMRVSSSVRNSLKKTTLGTSWIKLLNFSALDLRHHLEKQFTEGMTWERFQAGAIEIDHIIPVSFFNPRSADSIEFKMCWSLKNLQPLWTRDNIQKSNTLPDNFTELWNELYHEATRYAA